MAYKDPYWLTARFDSQCRCGNLIRKNDRIFYYPLTKTALCRECSKDASADFDSHREDERMMGGN